MHNRILNKIGLLRLIRFKAGLVLLLLILCQCASSNKTADHPFLHGLELRGFEQKGPLLVYNRQNIFEYMNGEAENYLPKGFILLYVGRFFVQGKDGEMVMEVYDMGSSKGAGSIFRVYTRPPARPLKG